MTDQNTQAEAAARAEIEVNGVFMGGGAKGIAYAGALAAMQARGYRFGSVAGASAGAITATLVAAGLPAARIAQEVPKALDAVSEFLPKRLAKAALGHATSVFRGAGLRAWLDETLRTEVGGDATTPVTFAELFLHKPVELYVVTMDLATGQPVVFCRRTTPDVEVAAAVAASSAIPGAFPGGRGVFHSRERGAVVHQFVDGGTWANYPAFVFADRSFRAWLRAEAERVQVDDAEAWQAEDDRPVVGFILGDEEAPATRHPIGFVPSNTKKIDRRFDRGPTYTSRSKPTYLFGALMSSDYARLILSIAIAVWVSISVAVLPVGVRRFAEWATWLPDWIYPVALVGSLAVVALAVVVVMTATAGLIITSRLLADTLVPSVVALVGVPTDVPPWVGAGDDAVVLRVPYGELTTTGFTVGEEVSKPVVELATREVGGQLDRPAVRQQLGAAQPAPALSEAEPERPQTARAAATAGPAGATGSVPTVVVLVGGAIVSGALAWWVTNSAGTEPIGRIILAVLVGLIVGGAALWFVGGRVGETAADRAEHGIGAADDKRLLKAWVLAGIAAVLLVCAVVVSVTAMDTRDDNTVEMTVTSGIDGRADNTYLVQAQDGEPIELKTERHLRIGERVFVEIEPNQPAELVGPLDDGWFAVAIVLWLLGFGVLTTALRLRNWETRSQRLSELVEGWKPA